MLFWPYMLTASGEKDLRVSCSICHIKAGIPFYSTTFFLRMQKLYHNPNKWWSKNQTKLGVCQPCKPLVAFATAHFCIRDQSSRLAHCGAAQMPARNSSSKETAVGLRVWKDEPLLPTLPVRQFLAVPLSAKKEGCREISCGHGSWAKPWHQGLSAQHGMPQHGMGLSRHQESSRKT